MKLGISTKLNRIYNRPGATQGRLAAVRYGVRRHKIRTVAVFSLLVLAASLAQGVFFGNRQADAAGITLRSTSSGGTTDEFTSRTPASSASNGSTSLSLNKPGGAVQDDVLIAAITVRGNITFGTVPTGWASINRTVTSGSEITQEVWWLRAGGSEPSSYTWGWTGSEKVSGVIMAYAGATPSGTPIDTSVSGNAGTGTTITATTITPTITNTKLVAIFGAANSGTVTSAAMNDLISDTSGGGPANSRTRTLISDENYATATATGSRTASTTNAANIGQLFAIKPVGATSLSLSMPSGVVQNDVMLAVITVRGNTAVSAPDANWHAVDNQVTGGSEIKQFVWWKAAGASEAGPYTFTWSGNQKSSGAIVAYSNVNTTSPVHASSGKDNTSSTTVSTNSITTTDINTQIVGFFGIANNSSLTAVAPQTSQAIQTSTGMTNLTSTMIADDFLSSATSNFTRSATAGTGGVSVGQLVALAPAPAVVTQGEYRWFANADSAVPPSVITENPSSNDDAINAVTSDGTYFYYVGYDRSPGAGDAEWRIEKRLISNGSLDSNFGSGGVITSNPSSTDDIATAVTNDGTYMVVGGYDSVGGDKEWRFEKYRMSDGQICSGTICGGVTFGTAGAFQNDISSSADDVLTSLAIGTSDSNYFYAGGRDGNEASNLGRPTVHRHRWDNGALCASGICTGGTFGSGGGLAPNPTSSEDGFNGVVDFSGEIYTAGYNGNNNSDWYSVKADDVLGALDGSYGSSGQVAENVSANDDKITALAVDSSNVYLAGYDSSAGASDSEWRIKKLDNTAGGAVGGFGTSGIVTNNPSANADKITSEVIDTAGGYIYVGGFDSTNGSSDSQWRIEKRSTANGNLDGSFGTGGVWTANPSSGADQINVMYYNSSSGYLYAAGSDNSQGNLQWRIVPVNAPTPATLRPLAEANTAAGMFETNFRLRMRLSAASYDLTTNSIFKLQFGTKATDCASATYSDVATGSGAIRFYDNSSPADSDATSLMTGNDGDSPSSITTTAQSYEESNNFTVKSTVAAGGDGLWDFSLYNAAGSTGTTYCFRTVYSDGSTLGSNNYRYYPELTLGNLDMSAYRWFRNAVTGSPGGTGGVTANPSGSDDQIKAVAIDSEGGYMYTAGYDKASTNPEWRIEKRRLDTGALCSAAACGTQFGTNGVIQENISANDDKALAIAVDTLNGTIFVAGYDGTAGAGNTELRVERRLAGSGALCASGACGSNFDTDGIFTSNPSANDDQYNAVALDPAAGYVYLAGFDRSNGATNAQERLEKRLMTTGAVDTNFGSSGISTSNPSANDDVYKTIAVDSASGYIYTGGYDSVSGSTNTEWRIEKRSTTDASVVGAFGTSGVRTQNPTSGNDFLNALYLDISNGYLYLAGGTASGSTAARIEKRRTSDGALCDAASCGTQFGTSGAVDTGTASSELTAIAVDPGNGYVYTGGYDNTPGNAEWRVAKRLASDGSLVSGFGSSGVYTTNPGSNADQVTGIGLDINNNYLYTVGFDRSAGAGDDQLRLEKYTSGTGVLCTAANCGIEYGGSIQSGIYSPGDPILAQNSSTETEGESMVIRLRALVKAAGAIYTVRPNRGFKLQFSPKSGTCDAAGVNETYQDMATNSGSLRLVSLSQSYLPSATANDPTDSSNPVIPAASIGSTSSILGMEIPADSNALIDYGIYDDSGTAGTAYCIRLVSTENSGTTFTSYSQIAELEVCAKLVNRLRHGTTFCNETKRKFLWRTN